MAKPGPSGPVEATKTASSKEKEPVKFKGRRYTAEPEELSEQATSDLEKRLKALNVESGDISMEEFLRIAKEDPEALYLGMSKHEKKTWDYVCAVEQELGDVKTGSEEEIQALRQRLQESVYEVNNLTAEKEQAVQAYNDLMNDREGTDRICKSTKLPDGKPLTDGKDPKFEAWLMNIENKLRVNADHFPTPESRIAYVASRCEGEAQEHILPRFREDATDAYQDVEDLIDHLKLLYLDENRVINARMEMRSLQMRKNDKFQEFLSKFTRLAQDSKLARTEWKEELYYRLSFDMQRAMIRESTDKLVSYEEFAQLCHQTANRLEQIAAGERRVQARLGGVGGNRGARGGTPKKDDNQKPDQNRLSFQERRRRMNEGLCMNCGQKGHFAKDCGTQIDKPHKEVRIQEIDKATDSDDSEKASA